MKYRRKSMNSLKFFRMNQNLKFCIDILKKVIFFAFQIKNRPIWFWPYYCKKSIRCIWRYLISFNPIRMIYLKNYDYDKLSILFITILDAHSFIPG